MFILDHVTQFVNNRNETAENLKNIGFNATTGGVHKNVGSANHLCYFDLFYIEMLSIVDKDKAINGGSGVCEAALSFLTKGEGFGNLAFETLDIKSAVKEMRSRGLKVKDPIRIEREQPDGFVSKSLIAYPELENAPVPIPIVLEREVKPTQRKIDLTKRKVIDSHEVGELSIHCVVLAVNSINETKSFFEKRFGLKSEGDIFNDEILSSECLIIPMKRGALKICKPKNNKGLTAKRLSKLGPGPFLLEFNSSDTMGTRRKLKTNDSGLVEYNGAWIKIN